MAIRGEADVSLLDTRYRFASIESAVFTVQLGTNLKTYSRPAEVAVGVANVSSECRLE